MALIEAGDSNAVATPNGTKPHNDEASDSAVHFGRDQVFYSPAKALGVRFFPAWSAAFSQPAFPTPQAFTGDRMAATTN